MTDYSANDLDTASCAGFSDAFYNYPKDPGDWDGDALQAYVDGYSDGGAARRKWLDSEKKTPRQRKAHILVSPAG